MPVKLNQLTLSQCSQISALKPATEVGNAGKRKIADFVNLLNIPALNGRGCATVGYAMFNMLTIGALYMQLSWKLFIIVKYSWIH